MKFIRALVTGGSAGIGLATAERLRAEGLELVLLSNLREQLDEAASKLRAGSCLFDLSESREGLWDRLESQHGPIDVLVNNAGIGYHALVSELDPARLRQVMEINFFAPADLCRQALARMRERGRGHIVNVTSASARRGLQKMGGYASSKAALHAFTQALRLEAAPAVGVSEILPISVNTSFFAAAGYRPKGVVQTPEHVANCVWKALSCNRAEICTHGPTAWGLAVDALLPNWVANWLLRFR